MTTQTTPIVGPRDVPGPAVNATIVRREDQTPSLARFWVRPDAPILFAPGQYLTLGIVIGERLIARPYSAASTSESATRHGVEFYVRRVQGGALTSPLWDLPIGERVRLTGPKGRFVLAPDDGRDHLFISSGTGSAPFIAMLRDRIAAGRVPRTVLLNGVSRVADLGYRDLFDDWHDRPDVPVTFVPTVSRPNDPANLGWQGRSGRVEAIVSAVFDELRLQPSHTVAYLCGNPEMIAAAERVLGECDVPADAIRSERYWPPGAEPRALSSDSITETRARPTMPARTGGVS